MSNAREIAEEIRSFDYGEARLDGREANLKEMTDIIARHIEGLAGIDFVCAHCGALAWINETSIDNGCTLVCVQCNEESVVELHTPKSYAERDALRARVEELEEALDIAEKVLKIAIRDVCEEAKEVDLSASTSPTTRNISQG